MYTYTVNANLKQMWSYLCTQKWVMASKGICFHWALYVAYKQLSLLIAAQPYSESSFLSTQDMHSFLFSLDPFSQESSQRHARERGLLTVWTASEGLIMMMGACTNNEN